MKLTRLHRTTTANEGTDNPRIHLNTPPPHLSVSDKISGAFRRRVPKKKKMKNTGGSVRECINNSGRVLE